MEPGGYMGNKAPNLIRMGDGCQRQDGVALAAWIEEYENASDLDDGRLYL